jgi:hypothetical protein
MNENLIIYSNNQDTIEINKYQYLTENTIKCITSKYDISKLKLTNEIKQCCYTNLSFSLITKDHDLITFGYDNFYLTHEISNKFTKIVSNNIYFCGLTDENIVFFWGTNKKKKMLKYKIDKFNNELVSTYNGFIIYSQNMLHLWSNLNNDATIIKNITQFINLKNISLINQHNNIYYIKNDNIDNIFLCDIKTNNLNLNRIKIKIIDKLMNDKTRLFKIVSKCIKNNIKI